MSQLIREALYFAERAHAGQVRKYTGDPYIGHPIAVASIVGEVTDDPNMLAAALLHDVIEDCDVTREQLTERFGWPVSELVWELTDVSTPEDGNRATRKRMDREALASASMDAQTIKLADLIHNTTSIVEGDPRFAEVYLKEKRLLVDVLIHGDARLWLRATAQVSI